MQNKKRNLALKKFFDERRKGSAFIAPKIFIFFGILLILTILFSFFGAIFFATAYEYYAKDLPEATIKTEDYPEITRIYDREGRLLFEETGDEKRIYIKVENISPHFLKAILAAEDQYFFKHQGIDFWANLRAIWQNFKQGSIVGGASTITQQLARNFFLAREVSLSRKIKEMILAQEIEKRYSKKEILEFYLNKISFGSNIYGIEAASRAFFGKSAQFLNLAESATLALIPRAPNRLFPYNNPEELLEKKDDLLVSMYHRGIIREKEFKKAEQQEVVFQKKNREVLAPHFVFYVLDKIKELYSEEAREKGLEVVTSLDLDLEEKIEALLKDTIDSYKSPYRVNDGAIVVLEASSGNILAMAGSYDFWQEEYGQYNSALAQRQPGSTLKPFIYALAIEKLGWDKKTILEDKPMDFNGYQPKNFSGSFRGKVSLEAALVNSLNLPAVYTLNTLGLQKTLQALENCHLKLSKEAGLSLAIGGASTNLLDLTSSYTALVNQGKCFPSNYFVRIKEGNGKILITNQERGASQVFEGEAIGKVNEILKKTLTNFPETKKLANLSYLKNTALKTGTSNGPRDLWAIGYNSDIIVGVWLGNHDNSLLKSDVYGLKLAVPLWAEAMKIAIENQPSEIIFNLD